MKILVVAPHPFYQERGTPIAVKLLVETLSEFGYEIDVLTFHEGEDINIDNVQLYRIAKPPFANNIPIGFSPKKLIADVYLTFYLAYLLSKNNYDVIHAVEESIFPAAFFNFFAKKKLIYDMDSSMADQLIEKWNGLEKISKILNGFEHWAMKHSDAVLPVCQYLVDKVKEYDPDKKVFILEDIAFESNDRGNNEDIRETMNTDKVVGLYVGNLVHYQGIDLLLEGISKLNSDNFSLAIIGGKPEDIEKYKSMSKRLSISDKVHFLGPRPLSQLPFYLSQADILISPRIKGKNTPMKIYSYLASGKPVLATNIYSHTQVLNTENSYLVEPEPESLAKGLEKLINNEELRNRIGEIGKQTATENYSLTSYKKKLRKVYDYINSIL